MLKLATGSDLEVQFLLKSQTKEQRQKWINAGLFVQSDLQYSGMHYQIFTMSRYCNNHSQEAGLCLQEV